MYGEITYALESIIHLDLFLLNNTKSYLDMYTYGWYIDDESDFLSRYWPGITILQAGVLVVSSLIILQYTKLKRKIYKRPILTVSVLALAIIILSEFYISLFWLPS